MYVLYTYAYICVCICICVCMYIRVCACQKVAQMCVGCREVICNLPHCITRTFRHPAHSHTFQVAQMCIGCQKVKCILPHGITRIFSHPTHSHVLRVAQTARPNQLFMFPYRYLDFRKVFFLLFSTNI